VTVDRRRPLLVNEGEFRTDEALREAAAAVGYGVHTKVRVADALAIDRSGLSDEAYSYALRSHFDWVVTDLETTRPEFAVEFDGDSHLTDVVPRRDALKDEVCERLGLPLLRIDRAGFRPTIRRSVIGYLVESWAMWKAFDDAQEKGVIPLDEVFEPWAVIEGVDENGNIEWRDMAAPMRRMVGRLWQAGTLASPSPWYAYRTGRPDDPDHAEAYAWVYAPDGKVIVGHALIRAYSFPAVLDMDLADDLAHLDLGAKISRLTEGDLSVLQDPSAVDLPTIGPGAGGGWSGGGVMLDPPQSASA
jgi:hypothetical protein